MTLEEKGRAALSYIKSIEDKRKEAAKLTARLKHQALLMVRGIDPEQIASIRTPPGFRLAWRHSRHLHHLLHLPHMNGLQFHVNLDHPLGA